MTELLDKLLEDFYRSDEPLKLYCRDGGLWVFAAFPDSDTDELELFRENSFQWKVVRIAQTSYLCFCPSGYSWNEIPLKNSDKSQELESLISYPGQTLPIRFIGLAGDDREIVTDRDFVLDETQTGNLLSAVKNQQFITQKQEDDLTSLGDPTPLLKAMQFADLPNILDVDLNETERTMTMRANMMPPREPKEPRARWILRHFEKLWGFEKLQSMTAMLETMAYEKIEREWKHCLLPVDIVHHIEETANKSQMSAQLKRLGPGYESLVDEYMSKLPSTYFPSIYGALMFNWRYSKGIYNFDDDVLKSIYLASLPVNVTPQIFTRLPEYCVYVKTPGMTTWNGKPMQGFFAMTEEVPADPDLADFITANVTELDAADLPERESSLYLLIDAAARDDSIDGASYIVQMPLDLDTIDECFDFVEIIDPRPEDKVPDTPELVNWLTPFLSQLLYLCSEEPEIDHARLPELSPRTEDVVKTKKGLKLFTPSRVNEWLCGWRTGSFIKRDRDSEKQPHRPAENTKTVRKHLRRAHWHTFYAGKRNAPDREVRIKWLQMIKVNFNENETGELPAVIKKVK